MSVSLSSGQCGLTPSLHYDFPDDPPPWQVPDAPPGSQTPPGQQQPSERPQKPRPLPYKTDFPVTWFGPSGWRYYDANKRGVKHFVPGAPYDEPPHASVDDLRNMTARQQQQRRRDTPSTNRPPPPRGGEGEHLARLGGSEGGTAGQRPLGLVGLVLRRSGRLRRAASWVLNDPARALLLLWGALMLACGIFAVLPAHVIASSTSSTETRGAALAIIQSIPILHGATRTLDTVSRVLRTFGRVPMVALTAGLMPLVPLLIPLLMPDHTRGMLTIVFLAAAGCLLTGYLFDDARFFFSSSATLRERLMARGQVTTYTLLMLFVGGVAVPGLALWVLGQLLPLTVLWLFNDTAMTTLLEVLFLSACIATPIAFFLRYEAEGASRAASAMRWRDPRPRDDSTSPEQLAALSDRARDAPASRRKHFHVRVFVLSIVIVVTIRELFDFVYPVPGAVVRARALMHRTGAWRPRIE